MILSGCASGNGRGRAAAAAGGLPPAPGAGTRAGRARGRPAAIRQDGLVQNLVYGKTAVVFDFYSTLTPPGADAVWQRHTAAVAGLLGVAPARLAEELSASFPDRMSGALGDAGQTMAALAARSGGRPDPDQVAAAVALRQELQTTLFALRPEAPGVLAGLRAAGLRIGLVSDCTWELPTAWPRLPLAALVDAPVFSCVEGTRKPDPRLFHAVADRLGVEPAGCLYVGDGGGRELTGASAVGMTAVLLAGPDWHPTGAIDRERGWTGARISSLTELTAVPPAGRAAAPAGLLSPVSQAGAGTGS
jgi:putative hydrolase of the HAD superfamily